jgi:hypothetical protein
MNHCPHLNTHAEEYEHDQLPDQMTLVITEIEVCDDCGDVVETSLDDGGYCD